MANRLLLESDVIRAVDEHTTNNKLDNDISCILDEVKDNKENSYISKQKRVELFENDEVVLEQRGNKYYLSLYDVMGRFKREITIDMKDDILEILSREDCYGNI